MKEWTFPQGDETITVQLTIKEAMALGAGFHFRDASKHATLARRKVQDAIDDKLLQTEQKR